MDNILDSTAEMVSRTRAISLHQTTLFNKNGVLRPARPGPLPHLFNIASSAKVRISRSHGSRIIGGPSEQQVIAMFQMQQDKLGYPVDGDEEFDKHRLSYTREQKLAAVTYAMETWNKNKKGDW
ncbi:MAG: hypothetical protein MMC33_010629, partial [Icmadophila ericetorum]|nr:hypothetical protein [Icmadophila ericetorum]